MPVLKTPKYVDHPAESLSRLISEEIKAQFLKTPKYLLIENQVYSETLKNLRNNYKYSYVVQWIYLLKHVIKLSDAFDVENFEEELLGIAPPIFLNSLKSKLIQFLKNEKLVSIDSEFDFFVDQIYQDYNLLELDDDNSNDMKHDDDNNGNNNDVNNDEDLDTPVITYSKLSLLEQIGVLYQLIRLSNLKNYTNFRKNIDKFEKPHIDLKIHPIFEFNEKNLKTEYIILQDARVYLRVWEFQNLNLPLDKSEYDLKVKNPYNYLLNLEPKLKAWECLTCGIYQYDNFIKTLKTSFGKKTSSREYALSKALEANIDFIIDHDLKKRKQGAQRKREIEMQMLMANRKRSSRLEEKEKRRLEEEEERRKELEIIKQQAAEMRAAKRQKLKDSMYSNDNKNIINLDTSLSREERVRRRQEILENSKNEQGVTDSMILIDNSNHSEPISLDDANQVLETGEKNPRQIVETVNAIDIEPVQIKPIENIEQVQKPVENIQPVGKLIESIESVPTKPIVESTTNLTNL